MLKIIEEFKKFVEKIVLKKKKIEYVSLTYAIKIIELGYKYFSNDLDAYMFCKDYTIFVYNVVHKLYGVEIDVSQKC